MKTDENVKRILNIKEKNPNAVIGITGGYALIFPTAKDAMRYFKTAIWSCEGAEKEDYENVYWKIEDGYAIANDTENWDKDQIKGQAVIEVRLKGEFAE